VEIQRSTDIELRHKHIFFWLWQRAYMSRRSIEELRDELKSLLRAQIESLADQTYFGLNNEVVWEQEVRLNRIREVSSEFLAALKRGRPGASHRATGE
jgi:hypothetical protein